MDRETLDTYGVGVTRLAPFSITHNPFQSTQRKRHHGCRRIILEGLLLFRPSVIPQSDGAYKSA